MIRIKDAIKKLLRPNDKSDKINLKSSVSKANRNREECILSTMEKRGWSREEAEEQIDKAVKSLGITYRQYNKMNFYSLPEDVQVVKAAYAKELAALRKAKEDASIESTMSKLGVGRKEAVKLMNAAKKNTGIDFVNYDKYMFAFLSKEEQQTKYKELEATIEKAKKKEATRERCIWKTIRNRDLNRQDAEKEIEDTIKTLNISYEAYENCLLYRYSPQDKIWAYNSFVERRKKNLKDRNENIAAASAKMNCSEQDIINHYNESKKKYGCTWKEYFKYKVYEIDEELADSLVFQSHMKKLMAKYNKDRILSRITDSKEDTNKYFDKFISRKWCVNRDITLEEFKELFENVEGVVYKPNFGMQGRGVEAFYFENNGIEEVYNEIMSCSRGVVEEIIKQHPDMNLLNPDSVNCLRIVTISSANNAVLPDGRKKDVAYVSVKIGRHGSIVDNGARGGIIANIDLEKGEIATNGVNKFLEVAEHHPDTGTKFKDFKIPYYKEAIEYVFAMIDELKLEGTIGWDIAISETGPKLVEPNFGPGISLLQDPWYPHQIGKREYMEKYLWDEK